MISYLSAITCKLATRSCRLVLRMLWYRVCIYIVQGSNFQSKKGDFCKSAMVNLFLPSLARRLQRTPPHLFLLSHIIPSLSSSPSPSSQLPFHFLFHALHQTSLLPTLQTHHFSTFQPFSAHNLDDPFDFNHPRFRTYDPHDRFLLRFLELLREVPHYPSEAEAMTSLDDSGIEVNSEMIYSAVWELREEWRLALLAFKWSEKWGCADEKSRNLLIWVLGNHRKFNTAWCLIRDMHQSKVDTRTAMLIMIDRWRFSTFFSFNVCLYCLPPVYSICSYRTDKFEILTVILTHKKKVSTLKKLLFLWLSKFSLVALTQGCLSFWRSKIVTLIFLIHFFFFIN